ncbi:LPXTG cell wall anchor domain-containing protein, partial [Streptococcus caprae]
TVVEEWIDDLYPVAEEPEVESEWVDALYPVADEPEVVEDWVSDPYVKATDETVENFTIIVKVDQRDNQVSHFDALTYQDFLAHLSALTEAKLAEGLTYVSAVYGGHILTLTFTSTVADEPEVDSEWVDELYPVADEPTVVEEWINSLYPKADEPAVVEEWNDSLIPRPGQESNRPLIFTHKLTGIIVSLLGRPTDFAELRLYARATIPVSEVASIIDEALTHYDLDIYDIHFINRASDEFPVHQKMTVNIPRRPGRKIKGVYYIDPRLKDELIPHRLLADGRLEFDVQHFSYYTVVYEDDVIDVPTADTPAKPDVSSPDIVTPAVPTTPIKDDPVGFVTADTPSGDRSSGSDDKDQSERSGQVSIKERAMEEQNKALQVSRHYVPIVASASQTGGSTDSQAALPQTGDTSAFAYVAFGVASLLGATSLGKRRRN